MNKDSNSRLNIKNLHKNKDVIGLIKALNHEDFLVQMDATVALIELGELAVEPLILKLKSKSENIRGRSALILGKIGDIGAVEPLIQKLSDDNESVKKMASRALGEIGDIRAVKPLIQLIQSLKKEHWFIKTEIASDIAKIGDVRAVELIIRDLKEDEYTNIRNETIETLLFNIGEKAVELLIQLMKDEDNYVQKTAKEALIRSSGSLDEESIKPIIKELEYKYYLDKIRENSRVEFKSSLRWDINKNCVNKELGKDIAKTISAFLNYNGGTIYIGISDDCTVYGIENDIKTLKHKNIDGFERALIQVIENYLEPGLVQYIEIKFEKREEKTICIVKVKPSPRPVYLKSKKGKEFYIRAGNTTRLLDIEQAINYIKDHWRKIII